jgi:hypothetical protein
MEDVLEPLLRRLARYVAEELRAGATSGMVDQSASSLGRRRHIDATRRRIASGAPGAIQLGRRYLLAPEALEEEIRKLATQPKKRSSRRAELLAKHGLEEARN